MIQVGLKEDVQTQMLALFTEMKVLFCKEEKRKAEELAHYQEQEKKK